MVQRVPSSRDVSDAVVVGSGATGGGAAKELTEAGLRVCLLEAGRNLDPEKDFTEHMAPYQIEFRGRSPEMARTRPVQSKCYACTEWNYEWWVNDHENPYTPAPEKPYDWVRLRVVAGARGFGGDNATATAIWTLSLPAATATAWTGPSATRTWLPTTRRWRPTSESVARPRGNRSCPTASSFR